MHFIVTGGAGFIGSHVTEQLLFEGHNVTVVDNLSTGNLQNLPNSSQLKFIQKNVMACQPEDFCTPVDGIVHLAATPSVTESWLRPLEVHHNNISATIAVIELCQALNIPKLVFASSAAVYGSKASLSISEEQPTEPLSPYGLQKLVCEQYASLLSKQLNFSFIGLRLFNVFGPRQLPNSQYSGVISIFSTAFQQNLPVTIYGDGTQTRDFIFVKDVAIAFTQALTMPLAPGSAISCNIGTGKTTSLTQLVNILKSFFPDWRGETNFAPPRLGDIQHSQADISKAASAINFIPRYSIVDGLRLLVEAAIQ